MPPDKDVVDAWQAIRVAEEQLQKARSLLRQKPDTLAVLSTRCGRLLSETVALEVELVAYMSKPPS